MMTRQVGTKGKHSIEFATRYEQLIQKTGSDPLLVLFKLLKCRTKAIQLASAKELLQYRFPKLASATLAVEQAAQMVMSWDDQPQLDKPSDEELANLSAITGESEVVESSLSNAQADR